MLLSIQVASSLGMNICHQKQYLDQHYRNLSGLKYDEKHITKLSDTLDTGIAMGGHFSEYFGQFTYNNKLFFATYSGGYLRVGMKVPYEIMDTNLRENECHYIINHFMPSYNDEWIQVVWFKENKTVIGTKTIFTANISLNEIIEAISNNSFLFNSPEKTIYTKGDLTHYSIRIKNIHVPISMAVDKSGNCHTLYPRVDLNANTQKTICDKTVAVLKTENFQNIVNEARKHVIK